MTLLDEVKCLDNSEIEEWICRKKLQANRLFREKMYSQAMECYLEGLTVSKKINDLDSILTILCNLASCKLILEEPNAAVALCNKALKYDDKYPRAYERRAAARIQLMQYELAKSDIETANKLAPELSIQTKLEEYTKKISAALAKHSKVYKKMMKGGQNKIENQVNFEKEEWFKWLKKATWFMTIPLNIYKTIKSTCNRRAYSQI
jgi:tetratricopeptide (TPR) repeat protein